MPRNCVPRSGFSRPGFGIVKERKMDLSSRAQARDLTQGGGSHMVVCATISRSRSLSPRKHSGFGMTRAALSLNAVHKIDSQSLRFKPAKKSESISRSARISWEIMIQDFRFACRQLMKAPGFAIAAVFVLALGIGANTAVFSLVNTMLFAPPGYARPDELVQIFSQDTKNPKSFREFSYPTLNDIREQNSVFSGVAGFNVGMIGIGEKNNTRRAFTSLVSANYFEVL